MDYRIEINISEFDERSSQFSCELTISNQGDEAFEVVAAAPRLPKGVRVNQAVDPAEAELFRRHAETCERLENMIGNYLITYSKAESDAYVKRSQEWIREVMSVRGVASLYASLFLFRVPKMLRDAREKLLVLPIASLREGERALAILKKADPPAIELESAEYILNILKDIETNPEFKASRKARSLIQRGQQHRSIYVLQAKRGLFGIKSYSVNFGIGLRSEDSKTEISRIESASLSVTPSPISLTLVAIMSALVGMGIKYLTTASGPVTMDALLQQMPRFLVAGLTALIVFNILDFTNLKDRLRARVSWRSAILVGFLCGYLTDRILAAVGALLGAT